MITYRIIPYQDYLRGIAPLRFRDEDNWMDAPFHDNPWALFQYYGEDLFHKVIMFPIGAFEGEKSVGYTLIYNISDTTLRLGGIYIIPEARGKRIGIGMCEFAISLWPKEWNRLIGYYRNDSFLHFAGGWAMREFPEHYWRFIRKNNNMYYNYKAILTLKELAR